MGFDVTEDGDGRKVYKCPVCERTYRTSGEVMFHKFHKHPVRPLSPFKSPIPSKRDVGKSSE